jgi:hypothetical protein
MTLNKRDERRLDEALERLEALCDEDNHSCTVAKEHKRAVRSYVTSWIIPRLRLVREQTPLQGYER